jgi:hypothetical protein
MRQTIPSYAPTLSAGNNAVAAYLSGVGSGEIASPSSSISFNNACEGSDSIGALTYGANPTVPPIDMMRS